MASVLPRLSIGLALVSLVTPHAGAYQEQLETGSGGTTGIEKIQAGFRTSISTGRAPLYVGFESTSVGDIDSWLWDFGDGTTSTEPTPVHLYSKPGTYSARLLVEGEGGADETGSDIEVLASSACTATNARFNAHFPLKLGTDFIPVTPADDQGFYVVYSGRHDGTDTTSLANNVGIFLFPVGPTEVVVFGGGYGDPANGPALNDAEFDALNIDACIRSCMLLNPFNTTLRFVVPHGHGDHINADIVRELRQLGYTIGDIAYHTSDGGRVSFLPGWTSSDRAVFSSLNDSTSTCGTELLSFATPLGKLWFYNRPGHTPGAIDAVLDVANDPLDRVLVRGSIKGGTCPEPSGVQTVIDAHGNVVLSAPGGGAPAPTLASIGPVEGSSLGGLVVDLNGTGFLTNTPGLNTVTFGGVESPQVNVLDDTLLRARVPAGVPGATVDVVVTNNNGMTAPQTFTYHLEPTLIDLSPAAGTSLGGRTITLTGAGFVDGDAGTNSVTLGGVAATDVLPLGDGSLTCTTPAGAPGTTVDVVLSNSNGSASLAAAYSYHPLPTLSSLSPAAGTEAGGTEVTLTGTGFLDLEAGANVITFGGSPATGVSVVDDGTLVCFTPAGLAGATVDVVLSNENGSSSLLFAFTYAAATVDLLAVTPNAGSSLGGLIVELDGAGFLAGGENHVLFGGLPATGVTIFDDLRIICAVPAGTPGATVDVSVQNDVGSSLLVGGFTYYPTPSLASVVPGSGPLAGGTSVTLSGSGFLTNDAGPNTVTFGGIAATAVSVMSDAGLTATTPFGIEGSVDVVVSNENGSATLPGGFVFLATPPVLASVSPTSGSSLGDESVLLSGSGFLAAGAGEPVVTFGGVQATSITVFDDTSIFCLSPSGAPGSTVDVAVATGNGSSTLVGGFTYHAQPVLTSIVPNSASSLGGTALTLSGSGFLNDDPGLNTVSIGGVLVTDLVVVDDSTLTAYAPPGTPGATVDVGLTNANGSSLIPGGFTYHAEPTLASVAPTTGSSLGGTLLTLGGSGFLAQDAGPASVLIGGSPATNVLVVDDGTLTCTTPPGVGTVSVEVTNQNGTGLLLGAFTYQYDGPTLTGLSPASASSLGGASVTLFGTGFLAEGAGSHVVTFGGAAAPLVTVQDDTSLLCEVPAGTAGATVDVEVTNDLGTDSLPGGFAYHPVPTLGSVTPNTGEPAGGLLVTLSGSGFQALEPGTNTITFGGVAATAVNVLDDSTLTCQTPAGAPGTTVDVELANGNGTGTLLGGFTYVDDAPVLTAVFPTSGTSLGGTNVTLLGSGFLREGAGSHSVSFGGVLSPTVAVLDDASLLCVAPAGPAGAAVDVQVSNALGSDTLPGAFTYHPTPALASVTPSSGSPAGGLLVTLVGSGFQALEPGASTITFGGAAATSVVVLNDTTLTCLTPAGAAGSTVDVELANGNGSALAPAAFTYVVPVVLASVSPDNGPAAGGTSVTLSGSGFDLAGASVAFGGLPATNVLVLDAGTITCLTPASASGTVDVAVATGDGEATLPAAFTFRAAPVLGSVAPAGGTSLGGTSLTLSGSGFQELGAGETFVTLGGQPAQSIVVLDDTTLTCVAPAGAPGAVVDVAVSNLNGSSTVLGGYTYAPVPTLASISPATGYGSGGTQVLLTGTGFQLHEPGENQLTFGGVAATSVLVQGDGSLEATTPPGTPGATVDVTLTNANGSATLVGSFTYTISPPTIVDITPASGASKGGVITSISGTGFQDFDAGTNTVRFGGVSSTTVVVVDDGSLLCIAPAGAPGSLVDVEVSNANGTDVLTAGFLYHPLPLLSSVAPASGPQGGGLPVTLLGSGFLDYSPGVNQVLFGASSATNVVVLDDSTLTCTVPAGVTGTTVDVKLTNANGSSLLAGSFSYFSAPVLTGISPSSGPAAGGTSVVLTGAGFLDETAGANSVFFGGAPAINVVTVTDTSITCETPTGTIGAIVDVSVVNSNGTALLSKAFTFTGSAPVLASLAPGEGTARGGTGVVINGSGFQAPGAGTTVVRFGGVPATTSGVFDDGQIIAVTPQGVQGAVVDVTVTNQNGVGELAGAFRYFDGPAISSITPPSGPNTGGSLVTILGSGFVADLAGTNRVFFGALEATSVTVVDDATLTCVVPDGLPGAVVDVRVQNANGQASAAGSFRYFDEPALASTSPASGPSTGGTLVTLLGSGFVQDVVGPNTVRFGGVLATSVNAVSDGALTCIAPAGVAGTTVDVFLENSNGSSSLPGAFTYHPTPTLASVTPASGLALGGTPVTLHGTGFLANAPGDNGVTFDGIPATGVAVVDDTTLTCLTPPGSVGLASVQVTNDNGSGSLPGAFEFFAEPTLSAVSPTSGSSLGGAQLTLTGTGFVAHEAGPASVLIGGQPATDVVAVDDSTLTCFAPAGIPGTSADVVLENAHATLSLAGAFRYHGLPTLAAVAPSTGEELGGTDVVLTGSGFQVDGAGDNQVTFGGAPALAVTVLGDGSLQATTPPGPVGPVDVVVSNANGSSSLAAGFTYFPSPPDITNAQPSAGSSRGGVGVILTGRGFQDGSSHVEVRFGEVPSATAVLFDDGRVIAAAPPGVPGSTVDITLTNANGSGTLVGGFTYHPAPALASVSPDAGLEGGGTALVLSGAGFLANDAGPNTVKLGGVAALGVVTLDDTTIHCTTPAGLVGPVDVAVSNQNGESVLAAGFRYFPATRLTAVAPAAGTPLGGTPLTLTGVGFLNDGAGANQVTIGGANVLGVTVVDDQTLTCFAPAGTPGTSADVQVSNENGTSVLVGGFDYYPGPVLLSVAPEAGVEQGGYPITLTGSGFLANQAGLNRVRIGGKPGTSIRVLDDSMVKCLVPAGTQGVVDITLENANGTTLLAGAFRYFPSTGLTSIEPSSGTQFGGTLVTVHGVGFADDAPGLNQVSFGGVPATGVTVQDDTTLTCLAPAGAPGSVVDVTVENANGSSSLLASWSYHPAPVLSSLDPTSSVEVGGGTATLTGLGFLLADAGPPTVTFGGVVADQVQVLGDTTVTCRIPGGPVGAVVDVGLSNANGAALLPGAFTYVASPPTLVAAQPTSGAAAGGANVTLSGSGFVVNEAGTNVVTFGGVPSPSVVAFDDATLLCTAPAGVPEAVVDIVVTNANGQGTLAGGFRYHALPGLTAISPASGPRTGGGTVILTGSGFIADGAGQNRVRFGGVLATGVSVLDDGTLTCKVPQGSPGTTVDVALANANGMTKLVGAYRYHAQPSLTAVSPPSAGAPGGRSVTLSGSGFVVDAAGANQVLFGGVPALEVQVVDDRSIVCLVPPGAPDTTVDVSLSNANGSALLVAGFAYHPAPVLASVSPPTGSTAGGTSVILGGSGFQANEPGGTTVTFGGAPATNLSITADGLLSCDTPEGAVGDVDVVLSNGNGTTTLLAGFHYFPAPPTLAVVAPGSGTSLGGTEVQLTGSGFLVNDPGETLVTFAGVPALSVLVQDDATLIVQAPPGAPGTSADVAVQNANGSDVLAGAFRYHALPVVSGLDPAKAVQTGGATISILGSGFALDQPGASLVLIGGQPAADVAVLDDTELTCTVPPSAVLGAVDVAVQNANGSAFLPGGFTYLPPPPTITSITPVSGTPLGGKGIAITGTGFTANDAGTNGVTVGEAEALFVVTFDDHMILCASPEGTPGAQVDVRVTNANGTATLTGAYRYHEAPLLTAVSPTSGPRFGGELMTLTGENFKTDQPGATVVRIGGVVAANLQVLSDTQLTCVVPAGASGALADVEVSNDNGAALLGGGYRYHLEPTLLAVAPSSGGAPGGRLVTLTGSGFQVDAPGPNAVLFGGDPATEVTVVDDATLTCRVPAGAPQSTVDVSLANANGQTGLNAAFSYHPLPVVAAVEPTTGSTKGGTPVTVTGSGFQANEPGANVVRIGGVPATAIVVVDDSTLECLTPEGLVGDFDVEVTNDNGQGSLPAAFSYFAAAPTLTALTPSSGTSLGDTVLTLTGDGFTAHAAGANQVTIGGVPATNLTVVGDTELRVTTPPGAPASVEDVVLTNANGSAEIPGGFRYHALPTLSGLAPDRGTAGGGDRITVTGSGFQVDRPGVHVVLFDGVAATGIAVIDDSTLSCILPAGPKGTVVSVQLANENGEDQLIDGFTYSGDAPVVSAIAPASGPKDGGTPVTLTGSGFVDGLPGVNEVLFGGVPATDVQVQDDGTITCLTPPGTAKVAADVQVTNDNGQTILAGGFFYHAEPTLSALAPESGSPVGGTTVILQGKGFQDDGAGQNVVTFGGVPATDVEVIDDATLSVVAPGGPEGAIVDLFLQNENGSAGLAGAYRFHFQPTLAVVAPTEGSPLGGTAVTLTGTGFLVDEPGQNVVTFDGVPALEVQTVDDTTIHCTSPAGVGGAAALVRVSNANGGGAVPGGFTYFAEPTVAAVSPAKGTSLGGTALTLTGSGFLANEAGPPTVTLAGQPATGVLVASDSSLTCVAPPGIPGTLAEVRVSNANGESAPSVSYDYNALPTVLAVTPDLGSSLGGREVTITGTGFKANQPGTNSVRFGGTPATNVIVDTDTTLRCVVPPGVAGTTVGVAVVNRNGRGSLSAGFRYASEPTLLSLAPEHGTALGGSEVLLSGAGFAVDDPGPNFVLFGGVPASLTEVLGDTTLRCLVPPGAAGTRVEVEVSNDNGTTILSSAFRYHATPKISSVEPANGTSLGGQRVTLLGSGFARDEAGTPRVTFGGRRAARVRVANDGSLSCEVPSGTPGTSVDVVVANTNGEATRVDGYSYNPLPTLASLTPSSGPYMGGERVTLTGTGFQSSTTLSPTEQLGFVRPQELATGDRESARVRVFLGDVEVEGLRILSESLLSFLVPPGTEGLSLDVRVETPDGSALLPDGYRYHLRPVVARLEPASGSAVGGSLVSLIGSGFLVDRAGEPEILFGGVPAQQVRVLDDSQIRVQAPPGDAGSVVDVSFANANGSDFLPLAFTYNYAPTLDSLVGDHGSSLGGTSVTLKGTGFLLNSPGTNVVTFDGATASNVVVVNDRTLTCKSPAGTPAALADVTVTNANGTDTLLGAFRYHAAPSVASVSPESGPALGSTQVTVKGSGFQVETPGTNHILFGSLPGTIQAVLDDSTLVALTPQGPPGTTLAVTVENDNGSGSLASGFHYNATPTLTSVEPDRGPAEGGFQVTLTGTGFLQGNPGVNQVTFAGLPATNVIVMDDTTLLCDVPARSGGSVADVRITNANGLGILARGFVWISTKALDLDDDGFSDLMFGAPLADVVGTDSGRAYVFRGRPAASWTDTDSVAADFVLTGNTETTRFGAALAGGDVNDDGITDAVVTGPVDDTAGLDAGALWVFFGPLTGDLDPSQADVFVTGELPGDTFGTSVTVGDLNGDGVADIAIGAPGDDQNGTDSGAVYVLFGHPGITGGSAANADVKIPGSPANDGFGSALASGDLDGDGIADLAIGAFGNSLAGTNAGAVFLARNLSSASGTTPLSGPAFTGLAAGNRFGYAVVCEDLDGDGISDLLVGAPFNGTNGIEAGAVYAFLGAPNIQGAGAAQAALVLTGEGPGGRFGSTIATGDLDADGDPDLVVAATHFDSTRNEVGRIYVFHAASTLIDASAATADVILTGEPFHREHLGGALALLDIDEDAADEIVITAPGNDGAGLGSGRAYIVLDDAVLTDGSAASVDVLITGAKGEQFGESIGTR